MAPALSAMYLYPLLLLPGRLSASFGRSRWTQIPYGDDKDIAEPTNERKWHGAPRFSASVNGLMNQKD